MGNKFLKYEHIVRQEAPHCQIDVISTDYEYVIKKIHQFLEIVPTQLNVVYEKHQDAKSTLKDNEKIHESETCIFNTKDSMEKV